MSRNQALAVVQPRTLWERIDAVRRLHHPAIDRWMPHLNLLYPFADVWPGTDFFADEEPFTLRLQGLGRHRLPRSRSFVGRLCAWEPPALGFDLDRAAVVPNSIALLVGRRRSGAIHSAWGVLPDSAIAISPGDPEGSAPRDELRSITDSGP